LRAVGGDEGVKKTAMDYLELVGGRVLNVYPERRDWGDHRVQVHVDYHRSVLRAVCGTVRVRVDAANVPLKALLHFRIFARLCAVVRDEFKDTVEDIEIAGASTVVVKLHGMLAWWGHIGTRTASKIRFVAARPTKEE